MSGFKKNDIGMRLTKLMAKGYVENHTRAQEGAFVVWIAIVVPIELLLGFDNVVFAVPESHAAMTAAKGNGPIQCEKSERNGYSMDICSYPRIDMGSAFDGGKDSPVGGLPQPHLLVSNNNNCSLLVKWFDVYHREWNVPHAILDIPFAYETQKPDETDYIVKQFKGLIKTIEELSGQSFDIDKTREAVQNTNEATAHWKRFIKCAEHRPSGITAFDSFVQMAPFLTMRGTRDLTDHFKYLADETEKRMTEGDFPIPNEKYRLLWDNIAPWHQLRKMQQRLAALDANIISASYTYNLGSLEGEYGHNLYRGEDPLVHLARGQNSTICPHGMHLRKKTMSEAIERAAIDGIIFASNRSCKPYSIMQIDQQRLISDTFAIPSVMIDVDHADVRNYSEDNAFLRIEALLERIDNQK